MFININIYCIIYCFCLFHLDKIKFYKKHENLTLKNKKNKTAEIINNGKIYGKKFQKCR